MNKIETNTATIDDVEAKYNFPVGKLSLPKIGYKGIFNSIFDDRFSRIHYALLTRIRRDDCNTSTQNQ